MHPAKKHGFTLLVADAIQHDYGHTFQCQCSCGWISVGVDNEEEAHMVYDLHIDVLHHGLTVIPGGRDE